MVSGGRNVVTSTSTFSRSRTAFWYSARLSRWNGREPGFGLSAAWRSIRDSNDDTSAAITAGSGFLAPGGGIMPARSLRIIFSVTSPFSSSLAASKDCSVSPLTRSLLRSLWQLAQYCLTSAVCSAASRVVADGACDAAGFTCLSTVARGACSRAKVDAASPVMAVATTATVNEVFSR
jgi:hypothetical protein